MAKLNSKPSFKKKGFSNFTNTLYELSAKVVENTKEASVGFKYAFHKMSMDQKFKRPVYGIGSKVMNNWKICNHIVDESRILKEKPDLDKNLVRVCVAELLWGNKKILGKGEVYDAVREKKEMIKNMLQTHVIEEKTELCVCFARINTLKVSIKVNLERLKKLGYTMVDTPLSYKKYLKQIVKLKPKEFMIDYHFNDLLTFNSKDKPSLSTDSIFIDKFMVFQSKSSLIPVHLMDIKPGDIVLDMCAAPGMKTSCIAARLEGKGEVWAVDKDKTRFKAMIKNLADFGAKRIVRTVNCDALTLRCNYEFDLLLLDAPCSGSGIVGRFGETDNNAERLRKLQWIQMKLLTNALTKYPKAKRIVYSTCSLYPEENEAVVDGVINKLVKELTYKLVDSHELISGFSKGLEDYMCGTSCIRVTPEQDFANGFFVAVFDKLEAKGESAKKKKTGNKRKQSKVKEESAIEDDENGMELEENENEMEDEEVNTEKAESEMEEEADENSEEEAENKKEDFKLSSDTESDDIPLQKTKLTPENEKQNSSLILKQAKIIKSLSEIDESSKTTKVKTQTEIQGKKKKQKKSSLKKNIFEVSLISEVSKKSKKNPQHICNSEVKKCIKRQKNEAKKSNTGSGRKKSRKKKL